MVCMTHRWREMDSNYRFRDALAPPTARPWLTPPDLGAGTGQKRSIFPEHLLNFLGVVRLR